MALHDLDKAHAIHSALLTLLVTEPGGASHTDAYARAARLCDSAVDAVNDVEARVAIRGVKSLAALLYSDDGYRDVEAGSLRGLEAVRFQIMNGLSAFRGRLEMLETRKPSRPEVPAMAEKDMRVLVVEDNRDSAESLRRLLEMCGYTVTVAHNAMDALESAKRVRPEVILCDIGLPDTDGFTLAEAFRENPATAASRLIAVTAYGKDVDRERSRKVGFDLHLVKPVNPGELLKLLEETPKPAQQHAGNGNVIDIKDILKK